MDIEILYKPAYSMGILKLNSGEEVNVEGGSMLGMTSGVMIETQATGGILKSLARSLLGGESFFMNSFRAPAEGGEIFVAPPLPGDLAALELSNEKSPGSIWFLCRQRKTNLDRYKMGGRKDFLCLRRTDLASFVWEWIGSALFLWCYPRDEPCGWAELDGRYRPSGRFQS